VTVTRVEVFRCAHPVAVGRGPAPVTYRERSSVFVRMEDDSGAVGWGETYASMGTVATLGELAPLLVGKEASSPRFVVDTLERLRPGRLAWSAVAVAVDDLRARLAGVPVSDLYGGRRREAVRAYASSGGYVEGAGPETSWPEDVEAATSGGLTACKIRIGRYPPRRELPLLERLKLQAQPEVDLMVDANGAYSLPVALEVGRQLGRLGYVWFEEPLTRAQGGLSYPGYEHLPPSLDIAVAGGEGLQTRAAFNEFLKRSAADIVQPDVSICGGIGEALFVAELAALSGCLCVPHCWGGAITLAATLQLVSVLPPTSEVGDADWPLLEYDMFENPMRTELLADQLKLSQGQVAVPEGPGLGIEVDEAWLRRKAKA
jgi:D-galactarolactone cycloisomerase